MARQAEDRGQRKKQTLNAQHRIQKGCSQERLLKKHFNSVLSFSLRPKTEAARVLGEAELNKHLA